MAANQSIIFHFQMFDPNGITGWSVTFVDWSEMKWHPRSFRAQDVTFELLKTMTVCLFRLAFTKNIICVYCFCFNMILNNNLFNAVNWNQCTYYKWWEGAPELLVYSVIFCCTLFKSQGISESSFLYAEKGIDKTLHMERNEAALLPVWEEVLPWNSW